MDNALVLMQSSAIDLMEKKIRNFHPEAIRVYQPMGVGMYPIYLTKLFYWCRFNRAELSMILSRCYLLEKLDIFPDDVSTVEVCDFSEIIIQHPTIRSVKAYGNASFSSSMNKLLRCPRITSISFKGCVDGEAFITLPAGAPRLIKLSLTRVLVFQDLPRFVSGSPRLEYLDIWEFRVTGLLDILMASRSLRTCHIGEFAPDFDTGKLVDTVREKGIALRVDKYHVSPSLDIARLRNLCIIHHQKLPIYKFSTLLSDVSIKHRTKKISPVPTSITRCCELNGRDLNQ